MSVRNIALIIAAGCLVAACGKKDGDVSAEATTAEPTATAVATALPEQITINTPGFLPEGVEYDTLNKRFLVGSIAQGTVFVVGEDGALTPFIQDPDLKSSIGIEVDEERNRLLVANSDGAVFQGQPGQAKLGIYQLDTGERIAMVDLAAAGPTGAKAHFANDIAVGPDGSAYVTDSMARVVYKVDANNVASVFLPDPSKGGPYMLNGIAAHPSGYLVVAESTAGDLYKVPLDKPEAVSKVKLPEAMNGADGILWHGNGNLLVVRNDASNSIYALSSTDDWATANVAAKGTYAVQATTAAVAGDDVYVVHPHFGDPAAAPFIERVTLAP